MFHDIDKKKKIIGRKMKCKTVDLGFEDAKPYQTFNVIKLLFEWLYRK